MPTIEFFKDDDPRFVYKEFRICKDRESQKWGIKIQGTDTWKVLPEFDFIEWIGKNKSSKNSLPVLVKFSLNKKYAVCTISEMIGLVNDLYI